jgi:hypothetical protein
MKIVLSTILSLVSLVSFAQTKEKGVMKNIEALNRAIFITKDSATLAKLIDGKVSYGHSSGKLEDKQVMIHNAVTNTMTYENFRMEDASLVVEGNTAMARHTLKAKTFDKGNEGVLSLGILQDWVNKKNDWVILRRQAVKIKMKR